MGYKRWIILFSVVAVAAALVFTAGYLLFMRAFTPDFKTIIDDYCEEYRVDKILVYAIIKAESGYDPGAVSKKGAVGLMQMTIPTANWLTGESLTAEDLKEPRKNIMLGILYLSRLNVKYTDIRHVLAAYNAGIGKTDEWIASGADFDKAPYKETADYIRRTRVFMKLYRLANAEN